MEATDTGLQANAWTGGRKSLEASNLSQYSGVLALGMGRRGLHKRHWTRRGKTLLLLGCWCIKTDEAKVFGPGDWGKGGARTDEKTSTMC